MSLKVIRQAQQNLTPSPVNVIHALQLKHGIHWALGVEPTECQYMVTLLGSGEFMSTVAHSVRTCVEEDPYLRFCMARGVISHAKLARWLQRERDMPGTEHAIISALRRMDMSEETPPMDEGRRVLAESRVTMDDRVLALEIPCEDHAMERLERLESEIDKVVRFMGEGSITLVLPGDASDLAGDILGEYYVDTEKNELSMAQIHLPEGGDSQAVLSYACDQLHRAGIEVLESHTGPDLVRLLINEEDGGRAYRILVGSRASY